MQWLIRNGFGRNGTSFNSSIIGPSSNFYFGGINQPRSIINACNDFFFIFDNGDYYLSNRGGCPLNTSATPYLNGSYEFIFPSNQTIDYAYLTNRYEEDDLPSLISSTGGPPSGSIIETININPSSINSNNLSPTSLFLLPANHSIVDNKDITFIIDNEYWQTNCTDMQLCFDDNYLTKLKFEPESFIVGQSNNVLKQVAFSSLIPSSSAFINNCVLIPSTDGNVFLNFKSRIIDPTIAGKSIQFYLNACGNTLIFDKPEPVSLKYHDPNFIRVDCVWEENGKKYAKYTAEFFNDGQGEVSNSLLNIVFPPSVLADKIKLLTYTHECNNLPISNIQVNNMPTYSNSKQFTFTDNLSFCNSNNINCSCTNTIEFCVELVSGFVLNELYTLNPLLSEVIMGSECTPIITFFDQEKCIIDEEKELAHDKKCNKSIRFNTTKCCECNCCKGIFCYRNIGVIIGSVIIGGSVINAIMRRRKRKVEKGKD
jgi:hypothetical protein